MKPWMKVLMWVGVGFGFGYFFGLGRGLKGVDKAFDAGRNYQKDHEEYYGKCREEGEARNALDEYRGDISTVEGINEILREPATDDDEPEMPKPEDLVIDPEIPQLHPQHLVPEIIGEEEYNLNIWHYDLENLIFYEIDEVLYNETTQSIIENPDEVLGIGTLFEFGGDPNNPTELIYVKNDTYGTLFRVDRLDAAFCDAVDGTAGPEEDDSDEDFNQDDFWNDV